MSCCEFGKARWGEVEINVALMGMAAAGGTVFLPVGTYQLSAPIVISSNVRLQGLGPATIISATGKCFHAVSHWFGEEL